VISQIYVIINGMTKRKKQRKSHRSPKRPSPKMMREVAAAMELFAEGDTATAKQQLLRLATHYPRNKAVLYALQEVSH
jgi:hypothetical protein